MLRASLTHRTHILNNISISRYFDRLCNVLEKQHRAKPLAIGELKNIPGKVSDSVSAVVGSVRAIAKERFCRCSMVFHWSRRKGKYTLSTRRKEF